MDNKYYTEEGDDLKRSGANPLIPTEHILTKLTYEVETVIVDPEETKKILEAIKNPVIEEWEDEDDEDEDKSKTSEDYRHENELIKQYLEEEKNEEFRAMGADFSDVVKDLDNAEKDENFKKFTKICASHPNQVLRYCRSEGSEPLWISDLKVPDVKSVPKCKRCGGKRVFEFQFNCQLLHYVPEITMLDWGVIAVYT